MSLTTALARQLKRWPLLYEGVARLYFALQPGRLVERVIGTRAREREWARRHLRKGNDWCDTKRRGEDDEWVLGYWDSRAHSHRRFLLEKVSAFYPFGSILEIGCNCGPNLSVIVKKFPDIAIAGIDINPRAIAKGKELFAAEGITNARLYVGRADRLDQFPDKSVDITLTDAVLIYVGPDLIRQVIGEMLRVTRRAIILVERHYHKPDGKDRDGWGFYHHGLWLRDYAALLKTFSPGGIKVTMIPEEAWPEEGWKDSGAVIEALV